VINALAGKEVAEIGHVKPTSPESVPYLIQFPETFSTWEVVDSRGIREVESPASGIDRYDRRPASGSAASALG
jgi:hypothetical protein